ncbi:MAG: tRNA (adenosine(37)-N6)-threonylcarbamoyltransferase complex ATPase subunit type 1 TsaE [Ignavibacteriaceae bacterium]|nr:tRNA (adenosine(37)-N6)-threonylcarbamoyltransferase complex ATPase subunit type 1 TsaE [Ignavibacteriaceae bacterium]
MYSEKDTENLASEFSSFINPGDLVILNGNLGSGKTFFIKEVLKSFNITGVSSPTFALVNEYYGNVNIYHFDFYRIEKINELYDIGFDEYMKDEETIKFIEWGNLFPSILPNKRIEIEIVLQNDLSRDFYFSKL